MVQKYVDSWVLRLAVLSISFVVMLRMTISPALATMAQDQSLGVGMVELVNMMAVLSLAAIPATLLSSFLNRIFSKKILTCVGLALYGVAGVAPFFLTSFDAIFITRIIAGIGLGFFTPMVNGLIADFWDGDVRTRMLGYQNSAVAIGNIVTGLMAGFLAVIAWKYSFLIYVFVIIVFFVVLFLVPEPKRKEYTDAVDKKVINAWMIFITVAMLGFSLCYFTFFGYLSFLVEVRQLGDAGVSGIAQTTNTVGSLLIGFVFVYYSKASKKFNVFVSLLINAVGYLILSFATSVPMLYVGGFLGGLGFGTLMPTAMGLMYERAPKSSVTTGTGFIYLALTLGTGLGGLFWGLISQDPIQIYLFVGIALIVAAVIALIMALFIKYKDPRGEAVAEGGD
jgi:MFS family permease